MNEWIDFAEEKPDKLKEYKVKIKSINTGFMNEFKALWVTKEDKFYSESFPVSENSNIIAWREINEINT